MYNCTHTKKKKKTRGEHFFIYKRTKVNIQIFHLVYRLYVKDLLHTNKGDIQTKNCRFFLFAFPIRCVRELLSFYSSTLIHIFDDDFDNKCKKYHHIAHVS